MVVSWVNSWSDPFESIFESKCTDSVVAGAESSESVCTETMVFRYLRLAFRKKANLGRYRYCPGQALVESKIE